MITGSLQNLEKVETINKLLVDGETVIGWKEKLPQGRYKQKII